MKKKIAALILCVLCLLSVAGCGQTETDTAAEPVSTEEVQETVTASPAAEEMEEKSSDDYLSGVGGTYVEIGRASCRERV